MIRNRVWVRRPPQTADVILVLWMGILFASCAQAAHSDIAFIGLTEESEQ